MRAMGIGYRLATAGGLALLLTGCWSHYGIAVDLIAGPGQEQGFDRRERTFADEELDEARAIVAEIANRHRMQRSDIDIPGNGMRLLVFFAGPYTPASDRLSHPAGGIELSLWVRTDRSSLSVWIVDWRGVGVTERLENLRDETKAALEAGFPGYTIRIEEQKLGVLPP